MDSLSQGCGAFAVGSRFRVRLGHSAMTWRPGKQSDDRATGASALARGTRRAVSPFQGQEQFQRPKREDCRQD
jgi:hypothetical protein